MSIGAVLSDARCRLGLSIGEVTRRTGIAEEIIWAIELDDFAKCGEDFYARGYISVIAAVVRVDATPLIAEYDATLAPRAADQGPGLLTLPPQRPPSPQNPPDRPKPPTRSERYRWRHRRRVALSTALCLAVLVIFGGEAYHFARDANSSTESASSAAYNQATTHPQPTAKPTKSAARAGSSPAAPLSVHTLKPVSATAYGQYGADEAGNPEIAAKAIDSSSSTAWQSKAYSSPDFDGDVTGTGVLLDLGRPMTITSAEVSIGVPGAWVELRGGTSDRPTALQTIGGTKDARATTTIRPQQIPVRYLVIWFTTLPQTAVGNYQASVYNVIFQGHS